jgi:Flp pilus assembly protein TadG
MVLRPRKAVRRGTYAVEFALVVQVLFFYIFAHILGGLMVFQYIETTNLAREGSRWASVHGWQWQQDQIAGGNPLVTPTTAGDVFDNAMRPRIVAMDLANVNSGGPLNYSVVWADDGQMTTYYDYTSGTYKTNTVTVTVSYQWNSLVQMFVAFGPRTMSARSTVSMQY